MNTRRLLAFGVVFFCLAVPAMASSGQGMYRYTGTIGEASPIRLAFPFKDDVPLGGYVLSDPVAFYGSSRLTEVVASGGEIRICERPSCSDGAQWRASALVSDGDILQVRMNAPRTERGVVAMDVVVRGQPVPFKARGLASAFLGTFDAATNVDAHRTVDSGLISLKGWSEATAGVDGGSLRVCLPSGGCGEFSNENHTVGDGAQLQLRGVSGEWGETRSVTLTVEGHVRQWNIITRQRDFTPDPFRFEAVSNVDPGILVQSNVVSLSGHDGVSLRVEGGEYQLCGDLSCTSADQYTTDPISEVQDGAFVRVRLQSASLGEAAQVKLTAGESSSIFAVTTRPQDTTPDAFAIPTVVDVEPATVATSFPVTPVGYEGVIDLAAEAGTGTEISVGNGPWVVGSTISEGQSFRVRATSSSSFGQTRTVSVSAGTRSVGFTVTTRPERVTPAVFAFSPSSNVSPVSYVVSGVARLTEMDPVTVSVENGEYQICTTPTCSDQTQWRTEATENVTDGSYVRLRVRSGAVAERVTARLIAGEGSATYVVTTRDHLSCSTPWGGSVAHGASVRAYQYSTRTTAAACTSASEIRTCDDGDLTGSYRNSFCEVPRNVAVTCTSNAGATRTITAYANGQDPLTGRAPSNLGTWVVFRNGTALNCDDQNNFPHNQDIHPTRAPADSATCRNNGGSGYGSYLLNCRWE